MADYYLAPSLVALRNEINARWPNRDKGSDGWLGDTAHAARKSDHNPDYSAGGVVRALDVDVDGLSTTEVIDAVVGDPRAAYVIYNRRIASATYGWAWRPYDGANPHDKHIHISIKHTRTAETDTSRWFTLEDDMTPEQEKQLAEAHARATWSQNQIKEGGTVDARLDNLLARVEQIEAHLANNP